MEDHLKTKEQLIAELELLRGEINALKKKERSPIQLTGTTVPAKEYYTILLVDDSEVDRNIYHRFLLEDQERTYQIVEFDHGEAGLEWCQQQLPDIFLLDYFLPDLDGLKFLEQLRQQTGREHLPVIILTSQGNTEIAVDLIKSGAQDYLDKSKITPQILHHSIKYILHYNQLIREREWQQQQQQLIAQTALAIRESIKLEDILKTTVNQVRNILECDRVIIFKFLPSWGGTVLVESVADDRLAIFPLQLYDTCIGKEYVQAFKQGLITAKSDIYDAQISPCHREFLASLQVRANLVVPLIKKDELWGLLVAHHCTAPRQWQSAEIELLEQIALQTGIAIEKAELVQQLQTELQERKQVQIALQELNTELEQRVIERTAQLTEVNYCLSATLSEKEQAYQQIEEQAKFLDLAHDSIITWDLNSMITFWNQGAESLYGWTKAEALGQKIHRLLKTQFPQPLAEIEAELFAQGYWEGELIHFSRKEHQINVFSRWVVEKDQMGKVIKILEINNDISDLKQTEAILQNKHRQEQLLWNITQAIHQSLDLNLILNTIVTEIRQILETDRVAIYRFNLDWSSDFVVESVGNGWLKLVESDLPKVWNDTYLQETQGGRFRTNEIFVVNDIYQANLQPCHIELLAQFQVKSYVVFSIFSGENLWGLLGIYENTTARQWQSWEVELIKQITSQLSIAIYQAELYNQLQIELQEREQSTAIIREAERRWRSLLDHVHLIVVGLDQWGNINYINPFFLRITGYTNDEVIGKNWFEKFIPSSHQKSSTETFLEVLNNSNNYDENPILKKSGEEIFIAWNNTRLQDSMGNIIGTISIGEDITERQKIQKIKDEFISIVSHEIRTPLTAIQMSLGLLNTGIYAQKSEKFRRLIEIAFLDTNRLVNLVNDILDLERLESGRAMIDKTICKAVDLIQQAVNGIQAIATQHQIDLVITPTDVEVWAIGDGIIQILINLLSNAIKFSPDYSTICISAQKQTDYVLFQVSDRGRGIPQDKLELIFGRFQQVDISDSREKGGTGLGLAICQSIIEQHGGKIWVESILGEGSTFFFTLPLPSEVIVYDRENHSSS